MPTPPPSTTSPSSAMLMAADRPSRPSGPTASGTPIAPTGGAPAAGRQSAIYDYLSGVVHDLRNPLGAAIGNLSFVRDGLAEEQADLGEAVDDAADAVRRVEALIDELVSVAQFEAGTLKLRPEPVDLGALVAAAADGAQREAGLRSVTLRAVKAQPVTLDVDRNLVRRVVESLIWCGFRATPAKGIIELRTGAEGPGRLTVACTGVVDVATGSAPAIYFARSVIDAHKGTLAVTSEPSFPTVIHLSWP